MSLASYAELSINCKRVSLVELSLSATDTILLIQHKPIWASWTEFSAFVQSLSWCLECNAEENSPVGSVPPGTCGMFRVSPSGSCVPHPTGALAAGYVPCNAHHSERRKHTKR